MLSVRLSVALCLVSTILLLSCARTNPENNLGNNLENKGVIVSLPQSVIDAAVKDCRDKANWGINLTKININYRAGTEVIAPIVLHNGDDTERMVSISYRPTYTEMVDSDTDKTYEPTPIEASGWVSVTLDKIRMDRMQTEVVPIHLLVPSSETKLPDTWEFGIRASGTSISEYQYCIKVMTDDVAPLLDTSGEPVLDSEGSAVFGPDTILYVHLPYPLLENKLSAIKDIISTQKETPQATAFDADNGILTVEGLAEMSVRELTIIYEYGNPVAIDYGQRWLVTMIN